MRQSNPSGFDRRVSDSAPAAAENLPYIAWNRHTLAPSSDPTVTKMMTPMTTAAPAAAVVAVAAEAAVVAASALIVPQLQLVPALDTRK